MCNLYGKKPLASFITTEDILQQKTLHEKMKLNQMKSSQKDILGPLKLRKSMNFSLNSCCIILKNLSEIFAHAQLIFERAHCHRSIFKNERAQASLTKM